MSGAPHAHVAGLFDRNDAEILVREAVAPYEMSGPGDRVDQVTVRVGH